MFNLNKVAFAVAGMLASAASYSASYDLFIAGASAQKNFWKADMVTSICGANTQSTYTITGATMDNEAWRCTAGAASLPTGINSGDIVTVHYNSHFGSISGAAAILRPTTAQRLYVNPDSADCSGTSCAVTGYDQNTETFTSTNGTALQTAATMAGRTKPADVVVLDVELKHWTNSDNWQQVAAFGVATPTIADVNAVNAAVSPTVVNGQVFSVIVNNAGPLGSSTTNAGATPGTSPIVKGNISKASLQAITTGKYDKWGDLPEMAAADSTTKNIPIKYCRREQGSGTQVAASIFLTGYECGRLPTKKLASIAVPGNLTSITEETSTGNVRSCVQGTTGAIGIASLSISGNYTTLNIDGVEPNQHNAAAGVYPFAFEDVVYDQTSTSGASSQVAAIAAKFITNASKASSMNLAESTAVQGTDGKWTATTRKANFALPKLGVNSNTVANLVSTSQAATAIGTRSGDNCASLYPGNTN